MRLVELSFNAMCTRVRTCACPYGRRPEIWRNILHCTASNASGRRRAAARAAKRASERGCTRARSQPEPVSNAVNCACVRVAHRGGLVHTRNTKINDFHHKMQIIRVRARPSCSGAGDGWWCVCVCVLRSLHRKHNCKHNNPRAQCACRNLCAGASSTWESGELTTTTASAASAATATRKSNSVFPVRLGKSDLI